MAIVQIRLARIIYFAPVYRGLNFLCLVYFNDLASDRSSSIVLLRTFDLRRKFWPVQASRYHVRLTLYFQERLQAPERGISCVPGSIWLCMRALRMTIDHLQVPHGYDWQLSIYMSMIAAVTPRLT